MAGYDVINVRRVAVVLLDVVYDLLPGSLESAIHYMNIGNVVTLVPERDCITTLARFDVQKIDFKEIVHLVLPFTQSFLPLVLSKQTVGRDFVQLVLRLKPEKRGQRCRAAQPSLMTSE